MKLTRTLFASLFLALAAKPSFAELTADQALENRLSVYSTSGITVRAGGKRRSGNVLTVDRFLAEAELPDQEGTLLVAVGGASFAEREDGTVLVTFPPESPLTVQTLTSEGEEFTLVATVRQSGARTVVSGTPDRIRYESAVPSITIDDFRIVEPDMTDDLPIVASIKMAGYESNSDISGAEIGEFRGEDILDSFQLHVDVNQNGDGESFSLRFEIADIAAQSSGTIAWQGLGNSLVATILDGNTLDISASLGHARYLLTGKGPNAEHFEISSESSSSDVFVKMDRSGIDYRGSTRGAVLSVFASDLFDSLSEFRLPELSARFLLPVVPDQEPQEFAARFAVKGFEMNQELWSTFDPAGVIDREPVTAVLDAGGEVIVLQDGLDGDFPEVMDLDLAPVEIRSLALNEIRIKMAGVEVTGDGSFAFITRSEAPWPVGSANFAVTGVDKLLDGLVEIGIVQDLQALAFRGMAEAFARPDDGLDDFDLTIETGEDGSVLVNDQRIQ